MNIFDLIEIDNIANELDEDTLNKLGGEIYDGYTQDKESRSSREQRMEDSMRLAMQITEEKSFPFDGCANVIIPIITVAAMQFAARAYPAIIRDDAVAKAKPIGSDDGVMQPVLDQLGLPELDENGQPMMQLVGKDAKKNRGKRTTDFLNYQLLEQSPNWEEDTDRLLHALPVTGNVFRKMYWSENKFASGIILPRNFIVDYYTTDLDKARKTQEFVQYEHEIIEDIRSGRYINFEIGEASDDAEEITPDTRGEGQETSDNSPHGMIEQHCRLDLDEDGYPEPYIATLHLGTKKLVRLEANYKLDGIKEKDGEIVKITPEQYFVKYGFIPSPDGSFYDLGFGDILYNLNESINSVVNRLLDAGTLASTSSGFVGRGLKIKGGTMMVKPGEFPVIDSRGGSIRDNFVQIKHPEPSPVLFQLLGLLIDMAEKITSTNQIVDGDAAGQMAGITMLQMTEQGLTGYRAIHKRVRRSLQKEFKILYRLNFLYLDREVYQQVLDVDGDSKADFTTNGYDIVPVADMTMLTDTQKTARANILDQYKDDPRMDGVQILKKIMNAIGEDEALVLGNPQPQEDPLAKAQQTLAEAERIKADAKAMETSSKIAMDRIKAEKDAAELALKGEKQRFENEMTAIKAKYDTDSAEQELANKTLKTGVEAAETVANTLLIQSKIKEQEDDDEGMEDLTERRGVQEDAEGQDPRG